MNKNSKTTTKHPIINWNIEKPSKWEPFQHGNFKKPDVLPPNEINFMGGLGEQKGNRRKLPQRPTNVQQIFNMRTRNHPVFSFVEDPKLVNSCFVPKIKEIDNPNLIAKKTGLADNCDTPTDGSILSQDLTEIFDFENPLGFDYQGFDHKETYQRDEQDEQNRKEYFIQKRNLDKRALKLEIERSVEDEERNEKYKIPLYFDLDYKMEDSLDKEDSMVCYKAPPDEADPHLERRYPDAIPFTHPDKVLIRLVRRTGKKRNIKNIQDEIERRKKKWTKNIFKKWNKIAEQERKIKEENERKTENFVMEIGEKFFEEYFTDDLKEILEKYENLPEIYPEKKYPHNLRETKYLRSSMNQERKLINQRLQIKSEFFKKAIKFQKLPNIPSENSIISEQSTDDEDELTVGPITESKFQLRGFHYRMDREPRGMICKKLGKHQRTCQTRNVWFQSLAPDSNPPIFFKNNPSSIPSKAVPTDDDYTIFEIESRIPKPIEISPIKEMIENPPPPPKILDPKKPKLKKPPYIRVKKFNLTAYLYGHVRIKKEKPSKYGSGANKYGVPFEMIERAETLFEEKLAEIKRKRHQRLKAMEIPFQVNQLNEKKEEEETSDSDSDNWIPSSDQLSENDQNDKPNYSPSFIKAPEFRQTTIRKHPRRLREPASIQDIVGSIVDKKIDPRFPFNIPRLNRLEDDVLVPSNLSLPKKDFVDLFQVRHHHDHKDCTQHKRVQVNFIPKHPDSDQKADKDLKVKPPKIDPFKRPERKKVDRSLPIVEFKDEINLEKSKKLLKDHGEKFPIPDCIPVKSRTDHLRKDAYENFIHEKTLELKKILIGFGVGIEDQEFKKRYLMELEADLESIKSCNSSVTSSVCTNFTNDSGSYILLQGKKVPFDFVTKSEVPFEEVDRTRIVAGDLPKHDEYYGPYYTVPFSGQAIDMRQMTVPKDKFYTNAVRSRFGIRNRLKIDRPAFHEEFIGTREAKYISTLATEWDEYYQHEIKNRPRIPKFRPKTFLTQHRESMRKQFSSIFIQEKNTEMKIRQQTEDEYNWEIENYNEILLPIFKHWEELFYRRSMRKMQELKPFFEKTDELKKILSDLRKSSDRLKMEIIYKEDDWIRRIILQNFHYLIMDVKWRELNDWIHLKPDGTLENFRESIECRRTVNIRKKDQDDAYAIKRFYEKNYLENFHEIKIVFSDTESFRKGITHLKIKSFLCLLELHYAMWIYANITNSYHILKNSSNLFLDKRSKYAENRSKKKYFMQDRVSDLVKDGNQMLTEPLADSIGCREFRTLAVWCDALFEKVIPENIQNSMEDNLGVIEKFGMISDLTLEIFGKIDRVSEQIFEKTENEIRKKRSFELRQAERIFANEIRINYVMEQIKKNMSKPVPRPPRIGKLPRSNLPKKVPKPKETKVKMPEKHKIFYNAFTDISTELIEFEDEETAEIINSIEDTCIPFHFDHFLKLHDYYPIYDFKTEIEEREGAEEKRFSYKDVLENVSQNLKKWMKLREKLIAEHISKTWYLYIDKEEKKQ